MDVGVDISMDDDGDGDDLFLSRKKGGVTSSYIFPRWVYC